MKALLRADSIAGLLTWLVVTSINIYGMSRIEAISAEQTLLAAGLLFGYLGLWLLILSESALAARAQSQLLILFVMFCIVIGIFFASPYMYSSILMGIVCSMLALHTSQRLGLVITCLASLPLYFIYTYYWQYSGALVSSALFWTFNIFAFIMMNAIKKEQLAREEAEQANLKLLSTQALLQQAVKQDERVRIARNIHDLLGHHLTALSIHLQVASRKSEGEVHDNIEKCHHLSKLLLSDVRDAVSDIRDKSTIDLDSTVKQIQAQIPQLRIRYRRDDNIDIHNIELADALLKCIQESVTNTLKHAKGSHLSIALYKQDKSLALSIENDGVMPKSISLGNGLKGMRERVEALKGQVGFAIESGKFMTRICFAEFSYE